MKQEDLAMLNLVEQCIGYINHSWEVEVKHVLREGNAVADVLAFLTSDE